VEGDEIGQCGTLEFGAGAELGLAAHRGEFVPGADGEAIVAAIDAVAHGAAEFTWDRTLMLDAVIGEALSGIQLEWRGERVGRADVEAAGAGAAAFLMRLVGGQVGGGEDGAEKEPGAEFAADEN